MKNILNKSKFSVLFAICLLFMVSCKKYVEISAPPGAVDASVVYNSDASATAAVLSLYSSGGYFGAGGYGISGSLFGGMSADELNNFGVTAPLADFQNNTLDPTTNAFLANALWLYPYQQILNANIAITSLKASTAVTPALQKQLIGEAEFWRAHAFFFLTNFFGAVPLSTSTDATANAVLPRTPSAQIYTQIINDLKDAKTNTLAAYPSTQHARVNQYAVSALLARVYLYNKDWVNAEAEATNVIGSNTYTMPTPDQAFVNTSNEIILQIYNLSGFNQWGANYVPGSATSYTYYLAPGFVGSFESGDKRYTNWVAPIGATGQFSISKYKLKTSSSGNEYYVVLRLAEQYLIRAEARAQQDNLTGALSDINIVRTRAGLIAKAGLTKAQLLLAIEQERKVELFGEYPHRWFDLKRTPSIVTPGTLTRADDVLKPVKPAWKSTSILFPIYNGELIKNPNLLPQNPGY